SAPVEVETAGVLERLTTRDKGAQITHLGMTRYRIDPFVCERRQQERKRVALKMRIGIDEDDDVMRHGGERPLQRARFSAVLLFENAHARITSRHAFDFPRRVVARAIVHYD